MKYLYKAMENLGDSNGNVILGWHEKVSPIVGSWTMRVGETLMFIRCAARRGRWHGVYREGHDGSQACVRRGMMYL